MDRLDRAKQILGLASVTLGVAALIAPKKVAATAGLHEDGAPEAVAAFGAKELASGGALLAPVKSAPFLWARVAGDIAEIGGLGVALRRPGAKRGLLMAGGVLVAAITLIDLLSAHQAMKADA